MDMPAALRAGAEHVQRQMDELGVRLLYVFHNEREMLPEEERDRFLLSIGAKLVDRKVTFGKSLTSEINLHNPPEDIIPFSGHQPTGQLYSLALQSGEYSRFRIDECFPPGSFQRLYRLWMEKSLDGTMADKVLIAQNQQGNTLGMVTLSLKGGQASIGLIAVDEKARGLKIGKKLMQSAEWHALEAGVKSIIVPTQLENKSACAFYEYLGYGVVDVVGVWHVWR